MDEAGGSEGGGGGGGSQRDILTAQVLLKKGKRYAAKYIRDECMRNLSPDDSQAPRTQVLGELLDLLLNPAMGIKNWDTIDWLKWLMAAGRTPDEFFNTGMFILRLAMEQLVGLTMVQLMGLAIVQLVGLAMVQLMGLAMVQLVGLAVVQLMFSMAFTVVGKSCWEREILNV